MALRRATVAFVLFVPTVHAWLTSPPAATLSIHFRRRCLAQRSRPADDRTSEESRLTDWKDVDSSKGLDFVQIDWPRVTAANFVSGAMLGPWLDNYHSVFGVLQYVQPVTFGIDGGTILTTGSWVPPLFGLAGIIIGGLYLIFDVVFATPEPRRSLSGSGILTCIAFFTAQYWLSGLLCGALHVPLLDLHVTLAGTMALTWLIWDRSTTGLVVGLLTGVGGPLIELVLINQMHLYSYVQVRGYGVGRGSLRVTVLSTCIQVLKSVR